MMVKKSSRGVFSFWACTNAQVTPKKTIDESCLNFCAVSTRNHTVPPVSTILQGEKNRCWLVELTIFILPTNREVGHHP